jgi:hypothetical protein
MEASSKSYLVEKVTLLGSARVRLKFEGDVLLTEYNAVFVRLITLTICSVGVYVHSVSVGL